MNIVVLGFGIMGKQISALLILMGYNVSIWNTTQREEDEKKLIRQIKLLKKLLKIENDDLKYNFCYDLQKLPVATYIECVKEDLNIKREIYKEVIDKAERYFSNTSSYKLSEIGEKVNGLHFFNPIALKLIEFNLLKNETNIIIDDLEKLDFTIVDVNDNRGFMANYILSNEIAMVFKLIEQYNYSYEKINLIYTKLYDGRNIFQVIDIIGIDTALKILENLAENDPTFYIPKLFKQAIENNIYGKKNRTSIVSVLSK